VVIRLEITEEQARILHRVLDVNLSELTSEISDTDKLEYRNILKERAQVLREVRGRLARHLESSGPPPVGP
jgi:hypothetical protein